MSGATTSTTRGERSSCRPMQHASAGLDSPPVPRSSAQSTRAAVSEDPPTPHPPPPACFLCAAGSTSSSTSTQRRAQMGSSGMMSFIIAHARAHCQPTRGSYLARARTLRQARARMTTTHATTYGWVRSCLRTRTRRSEQAPAGTRRCSSSRMMIREAGTITHPCRQRASRDQTMSMASAARRSTRTGWACESPPFSSRRG